MYRVHTICFHPFVTAFDVLCYIYIYKQSSFKNPSIPTATHMFATSASFAVCLQSCYLCWLLYTNRWKASTTLRAQVHTHAFSASASAFFAVLRLSFRFLQLALPLLILGLEPLVLHFLDIVPSACFPSLL